MINLQKINLKILKLEDYFLMLNSLIKSINHLEIQFLYLSNYILFKIRNFILRRLVDKPFSVRPEKIIP